MTTQKEQLYYCKLCGRHNFVRRAAHRPPPGVAGVSCKGDYVEQRPGNCFNCHHKASRACPDPSVITHAPWDGCGAWTRLPASSVPSVPSVVKPAPALVPTLNDGHDQATAKELIKRFKDAQTGLRRIVSFGLLAWEVKEKKLKPKQFGTWLAAHCPQLTRLDTATGSPKASSSLTSYMNLTKNVLESIGMPVNKYLEHISNSQPLGICHSGKYLLLPDKKLSPEALELKGKICEFVDGKTAKQLFFEFKQAEEDADGNTKKKVGRLKGHGGAGKLQRDKKALLDEKARLDEMEIRREEVKEWLIQVSDDKHLGLLPPDPAFLNALDTATGYLRRLARKGAAA